MGRSRIDFTGVNQRDYLKAKWEENGDLNKLLEADAALTAIRPIGVSNKMGVVWLCQCDCGNYREVPAKQFSSGAIKRCKTCVNPNHYDGECNLDGGEGDLSPEICGDEDWDFYETFELGDDPFYSAEFKSTWREKMINFNDLESLLYETIMDGRKVEQFGADEFEQMQMEAVDIVIRAGQLGGGLIGVERELNTFGDARIERARMRLN